jgi:hypothetical protein
LVKDLFCFKTGSEWTYYDSVSQTTQKMVITNYETLKSTPMPKGERKAYDYAEYIKINGYFLTDFEIEIESQGTEKEYDNTACFGGTYMSSNNTHSRLPLRFYCDKNNNFTCSVTFFTEYNVNGINYSSVYIFDNLSDEENVVFYVAKNIGLIRLTKVDNFDLVLIDKNIQQ